MSLQSMQSLRWLLGFSGAALLLVLVVGPVTPHIRFANLLRPYAAGIVDKSGAIDVVFVGTSRMRSSIMGHELEALLEERVQRPVVIYDLGKSARGTDADYLLLKETMRQSPVRLVVAEYTPGNQYNNHFFFTQAATWSDVYENSLSLDRPFFRAAEVIRAKFAIFMTEMFAGRWFEPPTETTAATTFDFTTPRGPNWERLDAALATGRQPMPSPPVGSKDNIVQDTYIRKIIEMVEAQGGVVVLTIIPGLHQTAATEEDRNKLEEFFGVDVIGLTDEDLANFTPHDYSDEKHHGWVAVDKFMAIVAQWLSPILKRTEPAAT